MEDKWKQLLTAFKRTRWRNPVVDAKLCHPEFAERAVAQIKYPQKQMRILLVEDAVHIRTAVAKALKQSGYAVDSTDDGNEGLFMALNNPYDVAILDIMLPGLDGLSILEKIRQSERATPVLFLTAKDRVEDRIRGLKGGADDYLVKPFSLDELLARVEALCRRSYQRASSTHVVADLEIDSSARTVRRAGMPIELRPREFALLEYLILREGQVISKTEIEEHIYDELISPMSNVVESAISSLRKIIAVRPDSKPLIHTKRGHGYFVADLQK